MSLFRTRGRAPETPRQPPQTKIRLHVDHDHDHVQRVLAARLRLVTGESFHVTD